MHLTGEQLQRLMRRHKVTIRELARRMQITLKTVRNARQHGRPMPVRLDYEEAIVGEFTPRMRAMLQQWQNQRENEYVQG